MENAIKFFKDVMLEIGISDPKHFMTIKNFKEIEVESVFYDKVRILVWEYFQKRGVVAKRVASDYLKMINDMRGEMIYFMLRDSYSCKNQHEAYENVYSKPEVMSYYMNALTISQLLWRHHFKMLDFYRKTIPAICEALRMKDFKVLEVGAGHGLYSYVTREEIPVKQIDIVDVSEEALKMTEQMIGSDRIQYFQKDIGFHFPAFTQYDIVIMGEVIEHLDYPEAILQNAYDMMTDDGVLWLTVPTNAPAIDHVYLFRSFEEVKQMIGRVGFRVFDYYDINIEGKTSLIGMFCVKK